MYSICTVYVTFNVYSRIDFRYTQHYEINIISVKVFSKNKDFISRDRIGELVFGIIAHITVSRNFGFPPISLLISISKTVKR